jgi:hypothetical protein
LTPVSVISSTAFAICWRRFGGRFRNFRELTGVVWLPGLGAIWRCLLICQTPF